MEPQPAVSHKIARVSTYTLTQPATLCPCSHVLFTFSAVCNKHEIPDFITK